MGLEVHHIIEKRFLKHLGKNTDEILSVVLTKGEHKVFTKKWREVFKYGTKYSDIGQDVILKEAEKIYSGYDELIDAAKKILDEFFG